GLCHSCYSVIVKCPAYCLQQAATTALFAALQHYSPACDRGFADASILARPGVSSLSAILARAEPLQARVLPEAFCRAILLSSATAGNGRVAYLSGLQRRYYA